MRRSRASGFSLIELMVTIAIVAILLALGLPSFEGSMRSNRLATTTNEMLASLSLARSEAIRSTQRSKVCASTDGENCDGTWNDGWMVSTDADDDDSDFEQVIRYVQGHPRLAIAGSAPTEIVFDYRGRPDAASAGETITLQPDQCPAGQQLVRVMRINNLGQVNTVKGTCP